MFPTPFRFAHTLAHQMPDVCRTLLYPNFGINLDRFWEFTFVGGFSPTLSGEIGLSEIRIVFAEASICPERTELLQRSLRETHFEATVTRFEFTRRISRIPGGPARLAQAPNSPGWPRLPIVQAGPTLKRVAAGAGPCIFALKKPARGGPKTAKNPLRGQKKKTPGQEEERKARAVLCYSMRNIT